MSVIRMVAYGVIEYPEPYLLKSATGNASEELRRHSETESKRREIRGMVNAELKANNLLMRPVVRQTSTKKYRTSRHVNTLWGPSTRPEPEAGWKTRPVLAENASLREVCIAALRYLEPENENLPTPPSKNLVGS